MTFDICVMCTLLVEVFFPPTSLVFFFHRNKCTDLPFNLNTLVSKKIHSHRPGRIAAQLLSTFRYLSL